MHRLMLPACPATRERAAAADLPNLYTDAWPEYQWGREHLARLQAIKRRVDPQGRLTYTQSLRAGEGWVSTRGEKREEGVAAAQ